MRKHAYTHPAVTQTEWYLTRGQTVHGGLVPQNCLADAIPGHSVNNEHAEAVGVSGNGGLQD